MSQTTVHFNRFLSAKWLNSHVEWNCEHVLDDDTHLRILTDGTQYERIFRLKLADRTELKDIDDLEVYIEPGLEDSRTISGVTATDAFIWMVASDEHAIGIQLNDITQYRTQGPYQPREGTPGRVLRYPGVTQDPPETANVQHWPRYFCMNLKPMEKVAFCNSPVGDGHLMSVQYDRYNPTIDGSKDLWLDVYRFQPTGQYVINYVKVIVTSSKPKRGGRR